jgi:hypothetical protein
LCFATQIARSSRITSAPCPFEMEEVWFGRFPSAIYAEMLAPVSNVISAQPASQTWMKSLVHWQVIIRRIA